MAEHVVMAQLASWLQEAGLPYIELNGWKENEQRYYWVKPNGMHVQYDGQPNGHIVHHTASSAYTPYVKNSRGQTKANVWLGLQGGDRLYHEQDSNGNRIPLLVLASAGPADYSSGSGVKAVLDNFVMMDAKMEGHQKASDDDPKWYGNRFYWNTEVIHPGYSQPLDSDVYDVLVAYCAVLSDKMGWSVYRNIAHAQHSRRKVDPRFEQGAPYTISDIQTKALLYQDDVPLPNPVEGDYMAKLPTLIKTDGFNSTGNRNQRHVRILQSALAIDGYIASNTFDDDHKPDGKFGNGTEAALKAWQTAVGLPQDGVVHGDDWGVLLGAS